jgi:Tol biopolymer transport system component
MIKTGSRSDAFGAFGPTSGFFVGASGPTVGPDDTLYYALDDNSSASYPDLFKVSKPYELTKAEPLTELNTNDWEFLPYITRDGSELYFSRRAQSTADGSPQPVDLYYASLKGDKFIDPKAVAAVNTPASSERAPVLSSDGLHLYFASDRPGGNGLLDIYVAHRARRDDSFGPTEAVAELNSTDAESPGWISPDNCELYFSSDRSGGHGKSDIWRASRRR